MSVTVLGTRYTLVNKTDEFPAPVMSSGEDIVITQADVSL